MSKSGTPAVIVLVVAVIIGGYLAWQLRIERQAVALLHERASALEQARSAADSTATTLPVAGLPQPGSPAEAPPVPATPTPATTRQQVQVMRADGTLETDPEASARIFIRMWFGDIEKDLGVTKEELEALVKLVARGDATPPEYDAATGGRWEQLLERQRSGVVENNLSALRSWLAASNHPLTDQQAEWIRSQMMAESRRRAAEFAANPSPTEPRALLDYEDQQLRNTEEHNRLLLASARAHLSPDQIAVWQESLNTLLNSRRKSLQVRRAQFEAGGSAAPPPVRFMVPSAPPPASSQ